MAAAITEYINAYFKGGQHNRSAPRHPSWENPPNQSCALNWFVLIPFFFLPDVW